MRAKQKIKVTFSLLDTQNWEIGGCSAILCLENSAICYKTIRREKWLILLLYTFASTRSCFKCRRQLSFFLGYPVIAMIHIYQPVNWIVFGDLRVVYRVFQLCTLFDVKVNICICYTPTTLYFLSI
jgi:hypothetical protein